jgi:glycosyltransferase-like protein LARGE
MDVSSGSSQLTVVTAATCDRLEALRAQCYSWPGPLSAAIYLPVQHTNGSTKLSSRATQQLEDAAAKVQALFKETEGSPDACALRVLLVYELVADELLPVILPVNSIRNVAMLAATTPLVAMVDVDLILSANLANQVLKDKAR